MTHREAIPRSVSRQHCFITAGFHFDDQERIYSHHDRRRSPRRAPTARRLAQSRSGYDCCLRNNAPRQEALELILAACARCRARRSAHARDGRRRSDRSDLRTLRRRANHCVSSAIHHRFFRNVEALIESGRVNDFFNTAVQQLADEGVHVSPCPRPGACHGRKSTTPAISSSHASTYSQSCATCQSQPNMQEIVTGSFAPPTWRFWPPGSIRVVDWNIDRGEKLPAIVEFLSSQNPDLLVLQEVDTNTRRARRLMSPRSVAPALGMNYVFGREFQELAEGSHGSPPIPVRPR